MVGSAKCTDGEIADNPGVTVLMDRVASLEELICDLLRQNEELRMALRESARVDSGRVSGGEEPS